MTGKTSANLNKLGRTDCSVCRDLPVKRTTALPDGNGNFVLCPELLTEDELIRFLRIPEISKANDYSNVIDNLKRMHDLPTSNFLPLAMYLASKLRLAGSSM